MTDHDLSRIAIPTIGLNASWMVHDSTYYCATDEWQFENYAAHRDINTWRNLFTAKGLEGITPKSCTRLDLLDHGGEPAWSEDLVHGIYICTSIVWFALQIALWMGFERAYLVAFDLCARDGAIKFKGHPKEQESAIARWTSKVCRAIGRDPLTSQDALMGWLVNHLNGRMEIRNISDITLCESLPKVNFVEIT